MSNNKLDVKALLDQNEWNAERKKLRSIILDCGLDEEVKWNKLCYCFEENNVVMFYGLKKYCALGFFKGSLLEDDEGILIKPGKHSQAMRQSRFSNIDEIEGSEFTIAKYIDCAIQIERDGLEVNFDEKDDLHYPDELQNRLDEDSEYAGAFGELTSGRQRGYIMHFGDAKKTETRRRRVSRYRQNILDGKGLNER